MASRAVRFQSSLTGLDRCEIDQPALKRRAIFSGPYGTGMFTSVF